MAKSTRKEPAKRKHRKTGPEGKAQPAAADSAGDREDGDIH